jgi:hypothetical protein
MMRHLARAVLLLLAVPGGESGASFETDSFSAWESGLSSPLAAVEPGLLPGANPALAFEGLELGIRRAYGLEELTLRSAGVGKNILGVTCSVCASAMGGEMYRETTVCGGFSHAYDDRLKVGARVKLLALRVQGLLSECEPDLDLGVQASPLPGFSVGASVLNGLGNMTDSASPTSSVAVILGSSECGILACAVQNKRGMRTSLGGTIAIGPNTGILAGISSNPSQLSAGIELNVRRVSVAIAAEWHGDLGLSESFGIRVSTAR